MRWGFKDHVERCRVEIVVDFSDLRLIAKQPCVLLERVCKWFVAMGGCDGVLALR